MDLLVKLSGNETYSNPLSVLLDIVKTELSPFKLAMLSSQKLTDGDFQVTGFCSEDYCPIYTAEEMLNTSPSFPILNASFIEEWKIDPAPKTISCSDCPDLFQGDLKYFGEAIVIPIWVNGKTNRWIVIVDYPKTNGPNQNDSLDLTKLSLLLNYALTNILRTEQKRQLDKARLWIDQELHEISRIQLLLLPQDNLQINSLKLAFKFKAYKEAGGDYLDLFQFPEDHKLASALSWGGIIADVTGHGPSAAVEAAMLDAILRTYAGQDGQSPAGVAGYVNKHFFTRLDRGKFITAKIFSYSNETKLLTYISAGHPSGYIKRGSEIIALDKSEGIPIGVLQDYQWENQQIEMLQGDILFIYTDVVLETRSPQKEEFGEQRLVDTLKSIPACPHQLVNGVEKALFSFSGGADLMDDLTMSALLLE